MKVVYVLERLRSVLLADRSAKGSSGFSQAAQRDLPLLEVTDVALSLAAERLGLTYFKRLRNRRDKGVEDV